MNEQKTYSWGELYETLTEMKQNGDDCQDELFTRIFTLFSTLDKTQTIKEVQEIIKNEKFTEIEINRINSSCFDGIINTIHDTNPLGKLVAKCPNCIDTFIFYSTRVCEERLAITVPTAIIYNIPSMLERLLALLKGDIIYKLRDNWVSLCTKFDHPEILQILLLKTHPRIDYGIYQTIIRSGNIESFKILFENANSHDCLHSAAYHKQIKIVQFLLENVPRLIKEIQHSSITLQHACRNNDEEMVSFLLQKGSSVDNIYYYDYFEYPKIIKLLLDLGPPLTKERIDGLLHTARETNNISIIYLLLEYGAKFIWIPSQSYHLYLQLIKTAEHKENSSTNKE